MSLTVDDETVRLAEKLAARLRVDKIEAIRVALANELRIYEVSRASATEPVPLREDAVAETDDAPDGALDPARRRD